MNSNGSENKSDRNLRSGRRTVALAEIPDEQDSSGVFRNVRLPFLTTFCPGYSTFVQPHIVKTVNTTNTAGSSKRARRAAPSILVAANPGATTRSNLANGEQRAEVDEIVPPSTSSKLRRRKRVEGAEETEDGKVIE